MDSNELTREQVVTKLETANQLLLGVQAGIDLRKQYTQTELENIAAVLDKTSKARFLRNCTVDGIRENVRQAGHVLCELGTKGNRSHGKDTFALFELLTQKHAAFADVVLDSRFGDRENKEPGLVAAAGSEFEGAVRAATE